MVDTDARADPDRPWVTIVWDDPINLMSYVTHVFMTVFGYPKSKARQADARRPSARKAVVSSGARERMELDVVDPARVRPVGHPAAGLTMRVARVRARPVVASALGEVEVALLGEPARRARRAGRRSGRPTIPSTQRLYPAGYADTAAAADFAS